MATKYDVHHYLVVRVKITDVEATDHKDAIEKSLDEAYSFARRNFDVYDKWQDNESEFAEEAVYALVDEVGDEEYLNSQFYDWTTDGLEAKDEQEVP